jgi:hypothetical protein
MSFGRLRILIPSLVLSVILAVVLPAVQGQNLGSVTGIITDQSGSVMPGATVAVINLDTGVNYDTRSTTTGAYTVGSLPPGRYRVAGPGRALRSLCVSPL